ncbi:MAG: 2-hydroxychromene-2-carboxylate isomerase [Pseudomonadota bacterium]
MPIVEYVYSAHSAFAYLGSAKFYEICAHFDATIRHRPILLSPVIEAQGSLPFHARTQPHVDYFFGRQIERWAEYRGVAIINHRPSFHDADYSLASGMIIALGSSGPAVDQMAHRLLEAHWRDDADLSDAKTLRSLAAELGHDPDELLEQSAAVETQAQLDSNGEYARRKNVFGSPTYIVDGDPFYGQDHLGQVAHALASPFAATTWKNPTIGDP